MQDYKRSLACALSVGLAFTQAAPFNINDLYDSIHQHVLSPIADIVPASSLKHSQDIIHASSIVSLLPEHEYEDWLSKQTTMAFESIINNIGGYGQGIDDVMRGGVIASPSKDKPDYYYQVCFSL